MNPRNLAWSKQGAQSSSERESGLSKIPQQVGARAQHWDPEYLPFYAVLSHTPWRLTVPRQPRVFFCFGAFPTCQASC